MFITFEPIVSLIMLRLLEFNIYFSLIPAIASEFMSALPEIAPILIMFVMERF